MRWYPHLYILQATCGQKLVHRGMVVRSFKKCGISLSLDSSENGEIHIESTEEYESPTANEITEFELDSESEIEDDEDNFEVTDSCSSSKNESCD